MEIRDIRAIAGISQEAFASKYGIPRRTIANWELPEGNPNRRECPEYVKSLLERVVKIDFESECITTKKS